VFKFGLCGIGQDVPNLMRGKKKSD